MELPKQYHNKASAIEHQRGSNWCTNHAISSLLEAQYARVYGEMPQLSNSWGIMLSKKNDGRPDATGTKIENLMDVVCKYGMCTEALYPTWEDDNYNDNKFPVVTEKMYGEAKKYKPKKRIDLVVKDVETIKYNIARNGGCVAIVRVYNEHLSPTWGCVCKPQKGSEPNGQHALWLCGYIEDTPKVIKGVTYKNWFIMQESYGVTRGYKGYLFVPYEAFTDRDWYGLYSNDQYIKSLHTFEIAENIKDPSFHDHNKVDFPYKNIELTIGSKAVKIDEKAEFLIYPATVEQGTTLVPFRFLCETLGYSVSYYAKDQCITAFSQMHNQLITMYVGNKTIKSHCQGVEKKVDSLVEPKVVDGVTLIPLRVFAELTGATVDYYKDTKKIIIKG